MLCPYDGYDDYDGYDGYDEHGRFSDLVVPMAIRAGMAWGEVQG
jgi:hypothetical protein